MCFTGIANSQNRYIGNQSPEHMPRDNVAKELTTNQLPKARSETQPLTSSEVLLEKSLSNLSSSATLREEISAVEIEPGTTVKTRPKRQDSGENHGTKRMEGKKVHGWPNRPPFKIVTRDDKDELFKKYTFWSDLTWREKYEYQREFLRLYLSETKQCLPYVRQLLSMIYRISPWRAVVILVSNLVDGFLPAIKLRTRGSFIIMVSLSLDVFDL